MSRGEASLLAVVINLRALAGKVDFNKIIEDRTELRQISGEPTFARN